MLKNLVGLSLGILCALTTQSIAASSAPAQQFKKWSEQAWIDRSMSLADLGYTTAASLDRKHLLREYVLPVPSNLAIQNAEFQLNTSYLRAEGAKLSSVVAIDGYPVAAHRYENETGAANFTIGVDGLPRRNGAVRLGVSWLSELKGKNCGEKIIGGNSLLIQASSRFSYRYQSSEINDLSTAWSALPPEVTLLVPGRGIAPTAFDTAWRAGVELRRQNKRVKFIQAPIQGDTLDLSGIKIPESLLEIPAFAALTTNPSKHWIKTQAELGALYALGADGIVRADVVIADSHLQEDIRVALAALETHIKEVAPQASEAFANWIAQGFTLLDKPALPQNELSLRKFAGVPVVIIPSTVSAELSNLLGFLKFGANSKQPNLVDNKASTSLVAESDKLLLNQVSNVFATDNKVDGNVVELMGEAERSFSFDLLDIANGARVPSELILDLNAAPNSTGEAALISVFVNKVLVGAKRLDTNGQTQRYAVLLPPYLLAARNELRLEFKRHIKNDACQEMAPVTIMPSSHFRLANASLTTDFNGIAGHYASGAELVLKEDVLVRPAANLQNIVAMATAVGFPNKNTVMQLVKIDETYSPKKAFLAIDVAIKGEPKLNAIKEGKLFLNGKEDFSTKLDLARWEEFATVEVVKLASVSGVIYKKANQQAAELNQDLRLIRGDFAILGEQGILAQLNSADPAGSDLADTANPQSVWEKHMGIWFGAFALIAFVLIVARITHVRHRAKEKDGH